VSKESYNTGKRDLLRSKRDTARCARNAGYGRCPAACGRHLLSGCERREPPPGPQSTDVPTAGNARGKKAAVQTDSLLIQTETKTSLSARRIHSEPTEGLALRSAHVFGLHTGPLAARNRLRRGVELRSTHTTRPLLPSGRHRHRETRCADHASERRSRSSFTPSVCVPSENAR
jgi:hypothetical protein